MNKIQSPEALIKQIMRWIRHRERMMYHYGAHRTLERMATVTILKTNIEAHEHTSGTAKCAWVLRNLAALRSIKAGKQSRYFHSDEEKLQAWEQYALAYNAPESAAMQTASMTARACAGDTPQAGHFSIQTEMELL